MKKLLLMIGTLLAAAAPAFAQWTTVTASNITSNATGQEEKLASGTLSFQATDNNSNPIVFQVGGGGQQISSPMRTAVTNGAIGTFKVPTPSATSPANIYYRVQIRQGSTLVYDCKLVTFGSGTFNFDNYTCTSQGPVSAPTGGSIAGPVTVAGNLTVTGACVGCGGGTSSGSTNEVQIAGSSGAFADAGFSNAQVQLKPICSSGNVQYVDALNGNDSNDGCSAGSAKLYVATAYVALYNDTGNGSAKHVGGTIYATDAGGYPIYWDSSHHTARIIGPNDPNWPGATNATNTIGGVTWWTELNGLHLVGYGCSSNGNGSAEKPQCRFDFGAGDSSGIGLQLSGTNVPMTFENFRILNVSSIKVPVAIAKDSNGSVGNNDNSAEISFRNYYLGSGASVAGNGPGMLVGSDAFEVYLYDGVINGNNGETWAITSCTRTSNLSTCTTPTNALQNGDLFYIRNTSDATFAGAGNLTVIDSTHFSFTQDAPNGSSTGGHVFTCRHAAICVQTSGGDSASVNISGDLHITNGGIFIQIGATTYTPTPFRNILSESMPTDDAALVVLGTTAKNAPAGNSYAVSDIAVADNATGSVFFQSYAEPVGFSSVGPGFNSGTGGNGQPGAYGNAVSETGFNRPCEQFRGTGFLGSKVCGEHDAIWRQAAPAFANLSQYIVSSVAPSAWTGGQSASYSASVATAVAGPDGFNDAGDATANIAIGGTGSKSVADGDIVIMFSEWKSPSGLPSSPTSPSNADSPFVFSTGGGCSGVYFEDIAGDASTMIANPYFGGNVGGPNLAVTEWERGFGVFKLRGTGTCTNIHAEASGGSSNPIYLYQPTMYYIPSGTISDAEAAAIGYYGAAGFSGQNAQQSFSPNWLSARRLIAHQVAGTHDVGATALSTSDFSISSGWGSSASIASSYTISFITSTRGTGSGTSITAAVAVQVNDLVFALVGNDGTNFTGISDTCTNTWTRIEGTSTAYTQLFYAVSNCASTTTITTTYSSGSAGAEIVGSVYRGAPGYLLSVNSATIATPTTAVSIGYTLPAGPGIAILFGVVYGASSSTYTSSDGMTGRTPGGDIYNADKQISASGTEAGTAGGTNSFGDLVISLGVSPSVPILAGNDQAFTGTLTANGTTAANPTITLTFHDGAWPASPIFTCSNSSGGSGTPALWLTNATTTALTLTYVGTPTTLLTYPFSCTGMGR